MGKRLNVYNVKEKDQILRMPGHKHVKINKGYSKVDEDVVKMHPSMFRVVDAPEMPDETPSDADNEDLSESGADDAGENKEPDGDDPVDPDADSKVDPPDDTTDADGQPNPPSAEEIAAKEKADLLAEIDSFSGKGSKEALEMFGRKFEVELDRRNNLKNMKTDLINALTEKEVL